MTIASQNPATGEHLKTYFALSAAEIDEKIDRAERAFVQFRQTPVSARTQMMLRAAEILESDKSAFGRIMTTEMGKPLKAAAEEAAKCAWACRYYAENGESFLRDEIVRTNAARSYVRYEPLGVVLAIMPWNFPFWQVFRFAAPALMAGNVGLLKHASNVPQCALTIEEIFRRAGFPDGVFQTLLIPSAAVADVLRNPVVKAVTLTGSEPAGASVASLAGSLIKKSVLELGGSDPFIVMPSANLGEAVRTAVRARTINNGESCIAAKRFIIAERIADEFEREFVRGMQSLVVGDPMDERTDVGPLATPGILEALDEQVRKSVALGARILTGGRRLPRPGNYYEPTVLTEIPNNAPAYSEELFGPVASLFRVKTADEAAMLANSTAFGLGSSVWTNDESEMRFFIDRLESGAVFINGMVASDPRLPFGGVKHAGYGRELSIFGIREFVNIKTVWIGGA